VGLKDWTQKKERDMREIIILECVDCKRRNYTTTKDKKKKKEKLELKKFCKFCRKHTLHREIK
jgi:large subunit ribosomal protein L33